MPNSLKVRIKKLEHDGKIDAEECDALLNKLEGHDKKLRADVLEEFVNRVIGNSTIKSTGEMVIEIRMDIFNFIYEQLKEKNNG